MKVFKDRVAFVTGGASGIGYGMVKNFLKLKMQVVIADFNPEHCEEVETIHSDDLNVHVLQVDVSDREQVREAALEAVSVYGKINVLCNNAGTGGGGNAEDPDFDAWDKAMAVNFGGVVNCTKIIAPYILENGEGGHIVNTGSIASLVPNPLGGGAYMTAKAAVRGYTEALRITMAPHGIGVSLLCPGSTRTRILGDANGDPAAEEVINSFMKAAMDPYKLGGMVVEGIKKNSPFIITHAEFRDEIKEIYKVIDDAIPKDQKVPKARMAFEDFRRDVVKEAYSHPVKD